MNELTPENVHAFQKRFQFRGGRLSRFRVHARSQDNTAAEVRLTCIDSQSRQRVRLQLAFDGVEEFRFQRRPGQGLARLREVQFGFFGDLTYLNLDPFPQDGPPKVMDFRASDWFVAARTVHWEVVEKKSAG